MKYIKTFEYFDSPELKGKFTPDEIKGLSSAKSPWDGVGGYRQFQQGSYGGDKPSAELNDLIHQARFKGYDSMYGVSEYLLKMLYKGVPDFKSYKYENDDDFGEGKLGIHLKKAVKLTGTRFDAESEIWIYYHTKRDKIFDYDNGKIYLLYTCGLRPTKKSFDLFGNSNKKDNSDDEEERDVKQSFSDMIKPTCKGCSGEEEVEFDDKGFDKFCDKLNDLDRKSVV